MIYLSRGTEITNRNRLLLLYFKRKHSEPFPREKIPKASIIVSLIWKMRFTSNSISRSGSGLLRPVGRPSWTNYFKVMLFFTRPSWANYFKIMQFFTRNWVYTPNFGLKIRIFLRFPPHFVKTLKFVSSFQKSLYRSASKTRRAVFDLTEAEGMHDFYFKKMVIKQKIPSSTSGRHHTQHYWQSFVPRSQKCNIVMNSMPKHN